MEYCNITELRESADGYKKLSLYEPEFVQQFPEHYRIVEPIERLHNAIDELSITDNGKLIIKTDEIRNMLDAYNPNQNNIEWSLSSVIKVVTDLREHVGEHMGAFLRIDPCASNVFCFLNAIVPILETELQRVIERKKYEPTIDDEKALKDKLIPFIEGKYGDMSFDTFMSRFIVINNVADIAKKRRLKYLMANCNDDEIKEQLHCYLEQCEMEIADHIVEQIPEPQPSPAVQATAREVATTNFTIAKVDADRLGSFFKNIFKSGITIDNHFDDLVRDIPKFKTNKELAMIAVLIYECRKYFIQRPATFTAWLREFFEIIGRECPKDTHKNKYEPNDTIKRMFYYLE